MQRQYWLVVALLWVSTVAFGASASPAAGAEQTGMYGVACDELQYQWRGVGGNIYVYPDWSVAWPGGKHISSMYVSPRIADFPYIDAQDHIEVGVLRDNWPSYFPKTFIIMEEPTLFYAYNFRNDGLVGDPQMAIDIGEAVKGAWMTFAIENRTMTGSGAQHWQVSVNGSVRANLYPRIYTGVVRSASERLYSPDDNRSSFWLLRKKDSTGTWYNWQYSGFTISDELWTGVPQTDYTWACVGR